MKAIFVFAVSLLLFTACSTDHLKEQPAPVGVRTKLISEVESTADVDVQKQAFSNLNPQEKLYIFTKRVRAKATELALTDQQKNHLNLLLKTVTADVYDENSAVRADQIKFLTEWTGTAKALFGIPLLHDIVGSLSSGKKQNISGARLASSCECSRASDYCEDKWHCTIISGCHSEGCGTLWLYTCVGDCVYDGQLSEG